MPGSHAFTYLNQAEILFLDAAVARLIPADALGPGAREADVTYFIDRQLASSWGSHGRNYRAGPWPEGTPRQGYQSPLTPREVYRAAIREIQIHCRTHHGAPFHLLADAQKDDILSALEADGIALESLSSRLFFRLLWRNTEEGFFSDPMYGGNKDKIGWRLIGFPGVAAADYVTQMERRNVPYRVEPVSILDVQHGIAALDAQGFPHHVKLNDESAV